MESRTLEGVGKCEARKIRGVLHVTWSRFSLQKNPMNELMHNIHTSMLHSPINLYFQYLGASYEAYVWYDAPRPRQLQIQVSKKSRMFLLEASALLMNARDLQPIALRGRRVGIEKLKNHFPLSRQFVLLIDPQVYAWWSWNDYQQQLQACVLLEALYPLVEVVQPERYCNAFDVL